MISQTFKTFSVPPFPSFLCSGLFSMTRKYCQIFVFHHFSQASGGDEQWFNLNWFVHIQIIKCCNQQSDDDALTGSAVNDDSEWGGAGRQDVTIWSLPQRSQCTQLLIFHITVQQQQFNKLASTNTIHPQQLLGSLQNTSSDTCCSSRVPLPRLPQDIL